MTFKNSWWEKRVSSYQAQPNSNNLSPEYAESEDLGSTIRPTKENITDKGFAVVDTTKTRFMTLVVVI